jgi:GrpB-like predicted nucleotidyltransferase (UPF0157 family)
VNHRPIDDLDEPVELVDYDPTWSAHAERTIREVRELLSLWEPAVEHVGSTSVPDLIAKPVIDLMVGLPPDHEEAVAILVAHGWIDSGFGPDGLRRYLRRRSVDPEANLHLIEADSKKWSDNLALREHLWASPEARAFYADAKKAAVAKEARLLGYSVEKASADILTLITEAIARRTGA